MNAQVLSPCKLTREETEAFHLNGFIGPFTCCTEADMNRWRPQIKALLTPETKDKLLPSMISVLNTEMQAGFGRHHDNRLLFELADSPAIKGRVSSIMGEDLLLWRTMFFSKLPGEGLIPWHQDYDDWKIEPMLVTSAWLAVDEATEENGCVQFVPGSHREFYPLVASQGDVMDGFPRMADPERFNETEAVSMELKPGQFFLFNERVLHRSLPNLTASARVGLAIRYIPPMVRILDPDDHAILLSGEDRFGFNQLVSPPPAGSQPMVASR